MAKRQDRRARRVRTISALKNQVLAVLVACGFFLPSVDATPIVNESRPITHQVEVQIIRTAPEPNGTPPATVLGNAQQRANIEAGVDAIWAQAGIDIRFLPTITQYVSSFAYEGITAPRPQSDLSFMKGYAQAAGKLNPDPNVINMFFVNVAPGFGPLGPGEAAGLASIGSNGIAMYIGTNLLNSTSGQDALAGVLAHEIGHNLGLEHTARGIDNLMSPAGTTDQMTEAQISYVFQAAMFFVQPYHPLADFTGDGMVNGSDLTMRRYAYAKNSGGDADADGDSDGRDFLMWQKDFGQSAGNSATGSAVPEPATALLLVAFVFCGPRRSPLLSVNLR